MLVSSSLRIFLYMHILRNREFLKIKKNTFRYASTADSDIDRHFNFAEFLPTDILRPIPTFQSVNNNCPKRQNELISNVVNG